jgi:hypothetical protein
VPVKAPHYDLMGGWTRHAGPATVQQALLRHPRHERTAMRSQRLNSVNPSGQAGEAR